MAEEEEAERWRRGNNRDQEDLSIGIRKGSGGAGACRGDKDKNKQ